MGFRYTHKHTQNIRGSFQQGVPEQYAVVVGKPIPGDRQQITGPSGDHLQFYLDTGEAGRYQVDVNTQSKDGTPVQVYSAVEPAPGEGSDIGATSGLPSFGVFADAELSYKAMGLTQDDFAPTAYYRIDAMLNAALLEASAVSVYGVTFDDGGSYGKGIHDVHMDSSGHNQDGALAVYIADSDGKISKRTWFFFKFANEQL